MTPEPEAPLTPRFSKRKIVIAGAIGVVALLGGGGVAIFAANQGQPAAEARAKPVEKPAPIAAIDRTNRISPESLIDLSYEGIVKLATIPAVGADGQLVTPEAYAQKLVKNLDGWFNSGVTEAEYKPYINGSVVEYEHTLQAKYDDAFISGIFAVGFDPTAWREGHQAILQNANLAFFVDKVTYDYNAKFVSALTTETQSSQEDDFTIQVTINFKDNVEASGIVDFLKGSGKDTAQIDDAITYSAHVVNKDGDLKVDSLEAVEK